jgi:CBS domain-containing protein
MAEAPWPLKEEVVRVEALVPDARDNLVTVSDKAQLMEAAARLGDGHTRLVVVCDDAGVVTGVVSKTDIVSRIGRCQGRSCIEMVATVMTQEVVCCCPGDSLKDVWSLMKEKGLLHIPVVDQERRPLGMLSARDVLQVLLGEVEYEETLLRDYVMGLGYR